MSVVFEVDPTRVEDERRALSAAADAVSSGGLVVFPTETVYGIATRPDDREATGRLFDAKLRPTGLGLPVLAVSAESAWEVAEPDDRASRLADAFWPGPLTMVLPRTRTSRPWQLGDRTQTVGVRVPDHPLTWSLLERTGHLAATSANLSGRPPLSRPDELVEAFGEAVAVYMVLRPNAPVPVGRSSTVVELTTETCHILRDGPIDRRRIEAAVASNR